MSVKATDVVAAARSQLGVQYVHQGRLDGVALDCLGLLISVGKKLGLELIDKPAYNRWPDTLELFNGLSAQLTQVPYEQLATGDVLLMNVSGQAQHLGIVTVAAAGVMPSFIHSYAMRPVQRVIEQPLDEKWSRRVSSVWRIPGIEQ